MPRTLRSAVLALAAVAATGCGKSEPAGPKETLNEKEKQQVQDLQDQRQQEWGGTKQKK